MASNPTYGARAQFGGGIVAAPISAGSGSGSGSGSSSDGIDIYTVRMLIDARVEASEATMRAHVQSELQTALKPIQDDLATLKDLPGTKTLLLSVFGAMFSGILAVLAILAFAGDRFDGGMSAGGALSEQAKEQTNTLAKINGRLDELTAKDQSDGNAETSKGRKSSN